jgi:hypothetical protein
MKKLVLTMASLVMLASMAFAQETPMLPTQHGMTDNQPAWGSSQVFDLAARWNWWSTYINIDDISTLQTALNGHADQIKSNNGYTSYNETTGTWTGSMTIDNSKMYMIYMNSAYDEARVRGTRADVAQTVINVNTNWNWVGYPVNFEMPVLTGLENYTPADGDMFKHQNGFVSYSEATGWTGNNFQLMPGVGYMMYSTSSTPKTFTYPNTYTPDAKYVANTIEEVTTWKPQMSSDPFNMNMIAVVSLDGVEVRSEDVEIGVFSGETCRGAVRPIYVEALDQYMVFLTMFGEQNEPYQFRMLDEMGSVYESNETAISYNANAIVGKLTAPFELKFTKNVTANSLNLFPNPVNRGEMVNMTLPEGTMNVEVINVLGSTLKSMRMTQGSELSADMAPGIYTIKVTDAEGRVYVDKLIVK